MTPGSAPLPEEELAFRPVTLEEWDDLQALFRERGPQHRCW